ncbi:MAG: MFS transporter [Chloroflexi bacterium]|nr:MFS transporter [Chloroflexota bacterium]
MSTPSDPTTDSTKQFHTDQVLSIAVGHLGHDTYSAFLAPLLPLLQERLGIGYALTGGLAIFTQLPSLLNPFLGYLADRVSLRYFVILAPAITGTLFSCLGLTSSYVALALLLLAAGVSIAAFHAPAPAMLAQVAGNRVGKGMSIFMAAGELGRTLGPLIVVGAVQWLGLGGIWRLALVGWLISIFLFVKLHDVQVTSRPSHQSTTRFWKHAGVVFPLLIWLMIGRSFMQVTLTTYLPIFMRDVAGASLWLAAASLTILEAAGVVGALFTGTFSDRWGRPLVIFILLGLAPMLLIGFLYSAPWLLVPLLIALGITAISVQPVLLALVQDEFPHNRALANGTFLGLNFMIRSVAIAVVGVAADRIGLFDAFLISAAIGFLSIPAVWLLSRMQSGAAT